MALLSGARLGPYEIVAPLGQGGMGEVYRARDTRLNRDVALKILPELFALDPDRLARFKREAQVLASLNHPNIAAIYGLEEADGVRAFVLEMVEGPTLAEVIERAQGSRLTAQGPDTPQRDSVTGQKPEALGHKPGRPRGQSAAESGQSSQATAPSRGRGATERGSPEPERAQRASESGRGWGPGRADEGGPRGIPMNDALSIARQIADALDAAHEHAVVHRDLKPSNIKLKVRGAPPPRTEDGRLERRLSAADIADCTVKVLDFGLAKAFSEETATGDVSNSPTMSMAATRAGVILGTAAYMSPEQARGKPVDKRADIWAFGCVLYEMLTGRQPFTGDTIADILGGIVKVDPDWSALPEATPTPVRTLLRRCLQKDCNRRLRDIADAKIEIEETLNAPQLSVATPAAPLTAAPRSRLATRERLGWMTLSIALAIVALIAVAVGYRRTPTPDESAVQFAMAPPENASLRNLNATFSIPSPSISADGRRLAFVAVGPTGIPSLWVRAFEAPNAQALPGTEAASLPFWSPDGRFVGFFAQGKLKKVDLAGGMPQTVADAVGTFGLVGSGGNGGATWSADGVILLAPNLTSPVYRVSATGGLPTPVTTLNSSQQETGHLWPYFLPDNRHFLYLVQSTTPGHGGIFVGSTESKETKRLVSADSPALYARPGYLLFLVGTGLMAQPFDLDRLEVTGVPVRVVERIQYNQFVGAHGAFSVSQNNTLVYKTSSDSRWVLAWFDRAGKQLGQVGAAGAYTVPSLSPDESKVAVSMTAENGNNDIWVLDAVRNTSSRLTFEGNAVIPIWSPDGNHILYRSGLAQPAGDFYQKLSSGAGTPEALFKSNANKAPTDWSADGYFVVYDSTDPKTSGDVWVLPTTGDRKPFPFLRSEFSEQQGRISPDDRWIAYTSEETGRPEVYVQSFPTPAGAPNAATALASPGGKWQISTSGGADPRWRRDGRELFFISSDRKLMAVDIQTGSTFQAGLPRPLFDVRVSGLTDVRTHYAVSADGRRFLVNTIDESDVAAPITVVLNWTARLKQ